MNSSPLWSNSKCIGSVSQLCLCYVLLIGDIYMFLNASKCNRLRQKMNLWRVRLTFIFKSNNNISHLNLPTFHVFPATITSFTISCKTFSYSVLMKDRVVFCQPFCFKCLHLAIVFKSVTTKSHASTLEQLKIVWRRIPFLYLRSV